MSDECALTPETPTTSIPTTGPIGRLKSIRLSLQETLEDDKTGKGSASRFALVWCPVVLSVALVGSICVHVWAGKDMTSIIQSLILAVAGGGAGPYTAKRVMEAFKGTSATPDADPGA